MLKNPIIKVHFHGVEVQIQHIPDYKNVEQNVANDTNKNVEAI